MKKSSQFSICVIMAVAVISTSCSSAVEKRAKHYQREGKTIVGSCRSSLFYYDDNALYCDNVEINKIDTVVDFQKEYEAIGIVPEITKEKELRYISRLDKWVSTLSFPFPLNEYEFLPIWDWGVAIVKNDISLQDGRNNREPAYVFLLSTPGCYYCLYEIPVQLFRNVIKNPDGYPILDYLNFTGSDNCLSNLRYFKGNEIDSVAYEYLDNPAFREWSSFEDLFWYDVDACLYPDGTCKNYHGTIKFHNLTKSYDIDKLHDGRMLRDFNAIIVNNVNEFLVSRVTSNAISFSQIVDDFSGNYSKAKKIYTKGKSFILRTTIEKVKEINYQDYKYRLETSIGLHHYMWIYTNDSYFAELDYPCSMYISADFERMDVEGGWITIEDRYFIFSEGEFLFVDN